MEFELKRILSEIKKLSIEEQIKRINEIKVALHKISPFKNEPVDCTLWIKSDKVIANDYNPNRVADPEMDLLLHSISSDGFTQPIVVFKENDIFTVVDGFHRNRVGKENKKINKKVHDYLPITLIRENKEDKANRIASTIRHNRARGKHIIEGMTDIVIDLKKRNWSDKKIGKELGMEQDEVLRLCQISGLVEIFKDKEFSDSWEAGFDNNISVTLDILKENPNIKEVLE